MPSRAPRSRSLGHGAGTAPCLSRVAILASLFVGLLLPSGVTAEPASPLATEMQVVSGRYVGDGSSARAITGVGFQPDLVIVKSGGSRPSIAKTATMPGSAAKELGTASRTGSQHLRSLDPDGFSVGSDPAVNAPGVVHYWIAFKSAAGRMAVGTYRGDGIDNRAIDIGFRPDYAIVMSEGDHQPVQRFADQIGDASLTFADDTERSDRIQAFQGSGFQVGTSNEVNRLNTNYHYVAWKKAGGKMSAGSYLGDGTDGRALTGLGLRPYYLILARKGSGSPAVQRPASARGDLTLPVGPDSGFANGIQALLRDGFELGSDRSANDPGGTFLWAAFQNATGYDLELDKSVNLDRANEGDTLHYVVTVTNHGPDDSRGVQVTDRLPTGLTLAYSQRSQGAYDSGTGRWDVGNLGAGATARLEIAATIDPASSGRTLTNVAAITASDAADLYPANNADTVYTRVPLADLKVVATVDEPTPSEAWPVTFTVKVSNLGPDLARAVAVLDSLSPGVTHLATTASRGSYLPSSGVWSVGDLAAGDSATLILEVRVDPGTLGSTIVNAPRLMPPAQTDPVAANDADSARIAVLSGEIRLVTGSYVGDGSASRAISGVGFHPSLLILKGEGPTPAVARTKTMAANAAKELGVNSPLVAGRIRSLDRDGFTVGADLAVNQPGVTYTWSAFREARGRMKVGSYLGDGLDNRSITGLGFRPSYLIVMSAAAKPAYQRYAAQTGDASLPFDSDKEQPDRVQAFEPDGFQIGSNNDINSAGAVHHFVAWGSASGLIGGGSYLGDGLDDRDIATGFRPEHLLVTRKEDGSPTVFRNRSIAGDMTFTVPAGFGFSDGIQSLQPLGFQVGSSAAVNASNKTFFWAGFRNGFGADLGLAAAVDNPIPNEGDSIVFTLTLTNFGPEAAAGIQVAGRLPAGLTYRFGAPSQGAYDPSTGRWSVGALTPDAAATLTIGARVDAGTAGSILRYSAAVAATDRPDSFADNDADSIEVAIQVSDLAVSVSADDATPYAGETVRYSVRVLNLGPHPATGVSVQSLLPAGLAYRSDSTSQGVFAAASGVWNVGSVARGGTATLTLRAATDPARAGSTLVHVARVLGADQFDPNAANNADSVEVAVQEPEFRLVTGSYLGDGTTRRLVTGLGFQPDLVIVKGTGSAPAVARSKTMTGDAAKELGVNSVLAGGRIRSLDRDGFTVGSDASVNQTGVTYTWSAFREAPGQMKVGSYVGDAADNRSITGLGFQPGYLVVMTGAAKPAYQRYAAQAGDASLPFHSSREESDRIQAFEPDGFQIGKNNDVNSAGAVHHFVAWSLRTDRVNGGLYLGNGIDDRTVTGARFRPKLVIVKRLDNSPTAHRPASLTGDSTLPLSPGAAFGNGIQALVQDGFQVGTDQTVNQDGKVYFWTAFRDVPSLDLAVKVSVDDPTPNEGDVVRYAVTLSNLGPEDATGVAVTDHLPAGVRYQSHIPSRGVYVPSTGVWTLGAVVDRDSATLWIDAVVEPGTGGSVISNVASVSALDQTDSDDSNDAAAADIRVQSADLRVRMAVDRPAPNPAERVSFTIDVINEGPDAANGVVVADALPSGLSYQTSVPSRGTYAPSTGIWTVGAVAARDSATLVLVARVEIGTGGTTITNRAAIAAADQADPRPLNDADSASIFVATAPGIILAGDQVTRSARPAQSGVGLCMLTVLNSSAEAETLEALTLANRTSGPGSRIQLDQELGSVTLYRDDGDRVLDPRKDTVLGRGLASGGMLAFDGLGVGVPSGSLVRFHVGLDLPLGARDGDTLDVSIDSTGVRFTRGVRFVNSWPVDPVGGLAIDGMSSAQLVVNPVDGAGVEVGSTGVLALDVILPPNGYEADVLQGIRLTNLGTALAGADVTRMMVWRDGGDGAFDAGQGDDSPLGSAVGNGAAWSLTGLSVPIPLEGRRIFASADLSVTATLGSTVRLGLVGPGAAAVQVASGNDGPVDATVGNPGALTIRPGPSVLTIAPLGQSAATLLPGEAGREVFAFRIVNIATEAETLESVAVLNRTSGPGSPEALDAGWLPLELRTGGEALGSAVFTAGRAVFTGLGVPLAPGDTAIFRIASGASLAARDRDVLDLYVPEPSSFQFRRAVRLTGGWPLDPAGGFEVDGMSAAQIAIGDRTPPDLLTGSRRNLALEVVLPANGYEPDLLQFLLIRNAGDAAAITDIERVEAWADDGNGVFEPTGSPGDLRLGEMFFTGDGWAQTGLSAVIPAGGRRLFFSCDIADQAVEDRTVRLFIPSTPVPGVGMASANDGPRDQPVVNPVTMTISTLNRITLTGEEIAAGPVAPGDTGVVVLHVVARNTYADSSRTLSSLTVTNATTGPGGRTQLDAETKTLKLRAGTPGTPALSTAFFASGKARFTGFAWRIPPGESRDLFVTADVSDLAAADGDVLRVEVADEAAVGFVETTSLSARFPLNSGAGRTIDGMAARQVTHLGAPGAAIGPGEGPVLALDWIVPRNGYLDDVLEGVKLANAGSATATDLVELRLWSDGGDGAFDAGTSDDRDLGPMVPASGRWFSRTLSEPIGPGGLRLFASVTASSDPADSATVSLRIPVDGMTVSSGNDGPRDVPVTNMEPILLSRSRLLTAFELLPRSCVVGDTLTARMKVRNVGELAILGIAPADLAFSGDAALTPLAGAMPDSFDLAVVSEATFTWKLQADSVGVVRLSGRIAGRELGTGVMQTSLAIASNPSQVFAQAVSLDLFAFESMPFSVHRGQTQVVPISLTLTHSGGENVSDILFRGLTIRLEDESGNGVVPADLLSRVVVSEGTNVYLATTSLPASGSTVDLTLARPVLIEAGRTALGQVSLSVSLDVSPTTLVSSFRLLVPDGASLVAEDANNQAPVAISLEGGRTFPIRSGLARIAEGATRLDVAGVPTGPRKAGRGQSQVGLLTMSLTNPGPVGLGPDIRVSSFEVSLADSSGAVLAEPGRVLKRIRVSTGMQTFLDRALVAGDDTTMSLVLSPLFSVPVNTPTTFTISADIADSARLGSIRLRVADTTRFDARSAGNGDRMPVIFAAVPIEGPAVTLQARADSIRARSLPGMPATVTVGASDVTAMTLVLSHPGGPEVSTVVLDRIVLRCRDQLNGPVVPATFLDRARALVDGAEVGLVTNFPTQGGSFTIPLAGVRLEPGDSATVEIRVDFEVTAPAVLFQLSLAADGVVAHDENLGAPVSPVAGAGAEFPFSSGVTRLVSPARELAAGFEESMPAVLVPDGVAVRVATLSLRNTASSGEIRLGHLELLAGGVDFGALPLGDVVAGIQAFVSDTVWAESLDVRAGATTGMVTGRTPLTLAPGAPVEVELRIAVRAEAAGGFRVGLRADGIGVIQPGSPLLSVSVVAEEGRNFPFWTATGSLASTSLAESYSNFPNPFAAGREESRFVFYMRSGGHVTLNLWTARGERVRALLDRARHPAGLHQGTTWDGRNGRGDVVLNGVYLAEIIVAYDDGSRERIMRKVAVAR